MMHRICLPILLILSLIGRGGAKDGYSGPVGQVAGKITAGGQPVPQGCQVVFQAKDGKNYMASGIVGAGGEYILLYNGSKDIPSIDYIATVIPPAKTGAPAQMSPDQMANPGQMLAPSAGPLGQCVPARNQVRTIRRGSRRDGEVRGPEPMANR